MSKAKLKKYLDTLSAQQLSEVILDLYSARKEAKEYLEFFLNPDLEKYLEQTKTDLDKCFPYKRNGRFKVTQAKKVVKAFESLVKEPTYELKINFYFLQRIISHIFETPFSIDFYETTLLNQAKKVVDLMVSGGFETEYVPKIKNAFFVLPNYAKNDSLSYMKERIAEKAKVLSYKKC